MPDLHWHEKRYVHLEGSESGLEIKGPVNLVNREYLKFLVAPEAEAGWTEYKKTLKEYLQNWLSNGTNPPQGSPVFVRIKEKSRSELIYNQVVEEYQTIIQERQMLEERENDMEDSLKEAMKQMGLGTVGSRDALAKQRDMLLSSCPSREEQEEINHALDIILRSLQLDEERDKVDKVFENSDKWIKEYQKKTEHNRKKGEKEILYVIDGFVVDRGKDGIYDEDEDIIYLDLAPVYDDTPEQKKVLNPMDVVAFPYSEKIPAMFYGSGSVVELMEIEVISPNELGKYWLKRYGLEVLNKYHTITKKDLELLETIFTSTHLNRSVKDKLKSDRPVGDIAIKARQFFSSADILNRLAPPDYQFPSVAQSLTWKPDHDIITKAGSGWSLGRSSPPLHPYIDSTRTPVHSDVQKRQDDLSTHNPYTWTEWGDKIKAYDEQRRTRRQIPGAVTSAWKELQSEASGTKSPSDARRRTFKKDERVMLRELTKPPVQAKILDVKGDGGYRIQTASGSKLEVNYVEGKKGEPGKYELTNNKPIKICNQEFRLGDSVLIRGQGGGGVRGMIYRKDSGGSGTDETFNLVIKGVDMILTRNEETGAFHLRHPCSDEKMEVAVEHTFNEVGCSKSTTSDTRYTPYDRRVLDVIPELGGAEREAREEAKIRLNRLREIYSALGGIPKTVLDWSRTKANLNRLGKEALKENKGDIKALKALKAATADKHTIQSDVSRKHRPKFEADVAKRLEQLERERKTLEHLGIDENSRVSLLKDIGDLDEIVYGKITKRILQATPNSDGMDESERCYRDFCAPWLRSAEQATMAKTNIGAICYARALRNVDDADQRRRLIACVNSGNMKVPTDLPTDDVKPPQGRKRPRRDKEGVREVNTVCAPAPRVRCSLKDVIRNQRQCLDRIHDEDFWNPIRKILRAGRGSSSAYRDAAMRKKRAPKLEKGTDKYGETELELVMGLLEIVSFGAAVGVSPGLTSMTHPVQRLQERVKEALLSFLTDKKRSYLLLLFPLDIGDLHWVLQAFTFKKHEDLSCSEQRAVHWCQGWWDNWSIDDIRFDRNRVVHSIRRTLGMAGWAEKIGPPMVRDGRLPLQLDGSASSGEMVAGNAILLAAGRRPKLAKLPDRKKHNTEKLVEFVSRVKGALATMVMAATEGALVERGGSEELERAFGALEDIQNLMPKVKIVRFTRIKRRSKKRSGSRG